ncbi:MAG: class B sortase [Clostridia bacterium]|nr:class B sortase [Clostridia bacterium]
MTKKIIIPAVILVIAAGVFVYSGIKLLGRQSGLNKGSDTYESLSSEAVSVPDEPVYITVDGVSGETVEAPVDVDFDAVKNKIDPVAWIYSEGTPIDYPIMQADDNDYYLRRLPDGTDNICGSIFMDHRCPSDFSAFNTIIYGHSFQRNSAYFGTLSKYRNTSYYNDHKYFFINTPYKIYCCTVFAGFVSDGVSTIFNIPQTEEEIRQYIDYVTAHSDFSTDVVCQPTDRIVVLSTCSYEYENARYVIFAKLS